MSILRTYNVQNPDSASVNVELSANGGVRVAGLSTFSGELRVGTGVTISGGIITATSLSGNVIGNVTGNVTGNVSGNVNSTGVSTFATANITQSNPTNLNVSGVSTFSGITTVTGPTLFAKQLNVSGVTTASSFTGNLTGNINATGVSTITTLNATSIVGVTTAGITTAYIGSVNDGQIGGFRNLIINGSMQVWQRGNPITAAGYTVDRFMAYSTNTGTANYGVKVTQQQDSPIGLNGYCAEIALSNTGGLIDKVTFGQRIEAINFYGVKSGESMTLSFYLKRMQSADSNLTIYVRSAGGGVNSYTNASVNQDSNDTAVASQSLGTFNSLSTSWTRYTFTFTVTDALITNGGVVFIQNGNSDLNVTNTNALYRTTGWQLEIGNRVTEFERRSYGQELTLCHRYFQNIGSTVFHCWGHRIADTEGIRSQVFTYLTPMRGAPTLSFDDGAGNSGKVAIESPARDLSTNVTFSFNQKYWGWDNGFKYPYGLTGFTNGVSGVMNVYNLQLSSEL